MAVLIKFNIRTTALACGKKELLSYLSIHQKLNIGILEKKSHPIPSFQNQWSHSNYHTILQLVLYAILVFIINKKKLQLNLYLEYHIILYFCLD